MKQSINSIQKSWNIWELLENKVVRDRKEHFRLEQRKNFFKKEKKENDKTSTYFCLR